MVQKGEESNILSSIFHKERVQIELWEVTINIGKGDDGGETDRERETERERERERPL